MFWRIISPKKKKKSISLTIMWQNMYKPYNSMNYKTILSNYLKLSSSWNMHTQTLKSYRERMINALKKYKYMTITYHTKNNYTPPNYFLSFFVTKWQKEMWQPFFFFENIQMSHHSGTTTCRSANIQYTLHNMYLIIRVTSNRWIQ